MRTTRVSRISRHKKKEPARGPRPAFLLAYNQEKLKAGFMLDRVLNVLFRPRPRNAGWTQDPSRILVIQSHLIGDVMMAVPLVRALRKRFPAARILFLGNHFSRDLLEGFDAVDEVLTAPFPWGIRSYHWRNILALGRMVVRLRRERIDLAVDAQIDFRNIFLMYLLGAKRRLGYDIVGGRVFLTDAPEFPGDVVHLLEGRFSLLRSLGADTSDKGYHLSACGQAVEWARSWIKKQGLNGDRIVAVHPGASTPEKSWPADRFAAVMKHLQSAGLTPVLIQGPGDADAVRRILETAGEAAVLQTSLKNLMGFLSCCRLVVCLDSAAAHLSSAVGTPAVVLYGPQWPALSKPFDDRIKAVWKEDLDCRPCVYKQCRRPRHECMEAIAVEDVTAVVDQMLDSGGLVCGLRPDRVCPRT